MQTGEGFKCLSVIPYDTELLALNNHQMYSLELLCTLIPIHVKRCVHSFMKMCFILLLFNALSYWNRSDTYFCVDKSVTSVVIKGLAEHKETLGAPLCPCRHYDDKAAEVKNGFWNCPCVPMRERKECHCMLFLKDTDDFAGEDRTITMEEVNDGLNMG